MAALVLSILTMLSSSLAFARDDGEARVVSLFYRQMPAQDVEMVKRLDKCGISGSPIAVIRDPVREGMEGIYLYVEKFDPNVICQENTFVFLRDRAFRKRLASLFEKGTSIVLGLHDEPAWPGAAIASPETLGRAIRLSQGLEPNDSDILILSRWASIYDFNTLEQQIFGWRLLSGSLEKSLKGIKIDQFLYTLIKDFIADARAIDSTLREVETAGNRIEYMSNEAHVAEAVSEPEVYRQYQKEKMLEHIQLRAEALLTELKKLAQPRPKEFRQILGAVNSMVPSKIMQHLGLNHEFDFDVKTASCVVELTAVRSQKFLELKLPPKSDN